MTTELPVAVIGAGPVGLAAAAHLLRRGLPPLVFERGIDVGASVREWGHVRVFSPWTYNIDAAARELLESAGWTAPDPEALPTGGQIVRDYLEPLAAHPAIAPNLVLGATVTAITREYRDKVLDAGREAQAFIVHYRDDAGEPQRARVRAVIDASGTWTQPNPIGVEGLPVPGEHEYGERIAYGIPDVLGAAREDYAGKTTLVLGGGHSAINVALDLLSLQHDAPGTALIWGLRRRGIDRLLGGGLNDELPGRGELGLAAKQAIASGRLDVRAALRVEAIESEAGRLQVRAIQGDTPVTLSVDRIVVTTGFRPDLSLTRELRIALDPIVEAPPQLAPLIDPNLHSCGTVPPHGVRELAHPEPGFYIVGMKSYGRAPTFLMATGYEQVRSVVAAIDGDMAAAHDVRLSLPETGVCSAPVAATSGGGCGGPGPAPTSGCCGGPAPAGAEACCALDAEVKADGGAGCGCATA